MSLLVDSPFSLLELSLKEESFTTASIRRNRCIRFNISLRTGKTTVLDELYVGSVFSVPPVLTFSFLVYEIDIFQFLGDSGVKYRHCNESRNYKKLRVYLFDTKDVNHGKVYRQTWQTPSRYFSFSSSPSMRFG